MNRMIAIAAAALVGCTAAMAQAARGDVAAGAGVVYGFGIKGLGLGAKFQYTPADNVRAEVGFNHYFKRDFRAMWDVNANAHYLINVHRADVYIYPLAGLCFAAQTFDEQGAARKWGPEAGGKYGDANRLGVNLGAGVQWQRGEHLGFTFEYRYTVMKDIDQSVLGLGVNYKF